MSLTTIGMISSYVGLNPRPADWLWSQSPEMFGKWKNIQIHAAAANPDFLLMYNFHDFPQPPAAHWNPLEMRQRQQAYATEQTTLAQKLQGVNPDRTIFLWREPPLDEVIEANLRHYNNAKPYCNYISAADDAAPVPEYMPAIWYLSNTFAELDQGPVPQKTQDCSWITSGISRTANHRQRLAFLQMIHESPVSCDFYGRDLPSWSQAQPINNKWYGMAPYYYNLAIENYADNDWYASEKLWDSLLAWCLPIYYGGSAADKLLPPGSYLRLPSLDEKGVAYIQEVTSNPDAWHDAKEAIAEAREIILHKLNLMNWLSEYVEKFNG
jgi:Glycosyltransferase family 10 (fucosyltransferase) C-term